MNHSRNYQSKPTSLEMLENSVL